MAEKELKEQGEPSVSKLMHRLASTPHDFLLSPIMMKQETTIGGEVMVSAVISDLIYAVGGRFLNPEENSCFDLPDSKENRNFSGLLLIIAYLCYDDFFHGKADFVKPLLAFFAAPWLRQLSQLVPFEKFITDNERREELVRRCLAELNLLPEGENAAVAKDRLNTLDSVERDRLIKKTREAQERARQIREALERKEAEEAASKMTRE